MNMLKNKVYIVTGANWYLWFFLVKSLLSNWAKVICCLRNIDFKIVFNNLKNKDNLFFYELDFNSSNLENDIKYFYKNLWNNFNKIDWLVNNAALDNDDNFLDLNLGIVEKIFKINFFAPLLMIKWFINFNKKSLKNKKVINISSLLSIKWNKNSSLYWATKASLNSLSRNLAIEFWEQGLNINNILISNLKNSLTKENKTIIRDFNKNSIDKEWRIYNDLDRIPLNRYWNYEEYINLIVFMLSDFSNYITWQDFIIDWWTSIKV